MLSIFPRTLLHFLAGVVVEFAFLCPALWGEPPSSTPKVLTSQWQKHVHAQLTGLDLTRDGQTVAFTTAPLASDGDSHFHVLDLMGREQWHVSRELKILGVSLADDGQYVAIGTMDFLIALFTRDGKLLWERQSVGLPYIAPQGKNVVALNSGVTGPINTLLEVFHRDGQKVWSLRRKGRVWRSTVSDQSDLLMGLWNSEVLFIDRQHRIAWQQMLPHEIMALAISPEDADYFAVATGVLIPSSIFTSVLDGFYGDGTSPGCDRTEPRTARRTSVELWQHYSWATPGAFQPYGRGGMDIPSRFTGNREFEGRHCPQLPGDRRGDRA